MALAKIYYCVIDYVQELIMKRTNNVFKKWVLFLCYNSKKDLFEERKNKKTKNKNKKLESHSKLIYNKAKILLKLNLF